MKTKGGIIAGIITLVIGGTVYSFNQEKVVNYFSKETGMSQEKAKEYVEGVTEDDLASFSDRGDELIQNGEKFTSAASGMDCFTYQYNWESETLPCSEGQRQAQEFGESEIELGKAYKKLTPSSASKEDITMAITLIDQLIENYQLPVVSKLLEPSDIEELNKINAYNKSLLQTVLDSK